MPIPAERPWPAGAWDVTDEIMAILSDLNVETELGRVESLAWPCLDRDEERAAEVRE